MKTMRYLKWMLVLFGLIGMTACRQDTPRFRIGVAQCSDDSWRHKMNDEILREAMFYNGVSVEIRSAGDDNSKQAEDVHYFMDEGVDLLIISANEAAPMTPIVEEAYQKGIPVILVDRKILSDKYTAYIGADNYEIGRSVGNYIASSLKGKGNIVELTGLSGSTPAMERHQGFMAAISKFPDIKLIDKADAAWERGPAEIEMDSMLRRHPKIDAVYAHNDRIAPGAYQAAKMAGREKEMIFVGIDALPGKGNGLELVLDSVLDATFIYPTNGDKVLQLAMDILEKKPYPKETVMNTAVVDRTNAHVMQLQTTHISELDKKIETLNGRIGGYLSQVATQQVVLYGSLIILLLVAGLLLVVYKSLRSKNRLNKELFKQKQQLEEQRDKLEEQRDQLIQLSHQLEEATHAKLVFFTNISHDFRTPLTLIADPINQLLADKSLGEHPHQLLELMKKNANILLRLVNQILDFRKVENGRMELHLEPFDLLSSFRGWNDSFRMALLKKHISFSFEVTPDTDFRMMADSEKMERIYFNLLSNAVKYTPENGKIVVKLEAETTNYRFSVFNSGSHISPKEVDAIFERFYQIDGHQAGTGIGLALVRAFVEMHGGQITAHSNEKGATFTVLFPAQSVSLYHPTVVTLPTEEAEVSATLIETDLPLDEEDTKAADRPTVLVIDDNADIRNYVKTLLAEEYHVLDASEAATGIRLAMKYVPDVIVSDVMMPGMDGIECCRRLKTELQTCHIPVILLTACSLDEQRIQGYNGGADSYISKPFNSQLLLSRIRNLIDSRRQLRQFFGDNQTLAKENICDIDKDFVSRFKSLVEEKMRDPELNVEDLGKDMGLSRVQLYRKLKSLTNYAPNELLRQARLKKAISLLASSEMTVAEIAYEVGFSSPSYFTKCYKEQFGESPTDFLKRKNL